LGRRVASCSGVAAVECDFVISSGSLVPIEVLEHVGGMEEALFIDQVDTEWCLRARSMGYRVFGVCAAVLEHRLGEGVRWFWLGRWRRVFRQKPFRYYYIFRNTLVLFRRGYFEPKFVPFHLAWLAVMLVVFGVFGGRSGGLRMMLKGLLHGLQGARGELQAPAPRRFARRSARAAAPIRQDSGHG
jgi:rhamnosyltransferase